MFRFAPFQPARRLQLLPRLATAACLTGLVAQVAATDFRINITADIADADTSDGRCDADADRADEQCSLRAAAEQLLSLPAGKHRILLDRLPAGSRLRIEGETIRVPAGTELLGNTERLLPVTASTTAQRPLFAIEGDGGIRLSGLDIRLGSDAGSLLAMQDPQQSAGLADLRIGSTIATTQRAVPALRLVAGHVDCLRCRFVDGGSTAIDVRGGELRLVDSLVSDNRGADGGGLHITGGRVWLQRSEVSRNRSEADGGGIRQSGGELWMVNSLLRGNLAARGGGGLAISGGVAELQNSSVIGNVANADAGGEQIGGGLLSEGKAKVRLRNSIVSANRVLAMTFGNECAGSEIFADAANFIGPDPGCQPRSADNDLVLRSAAAMTTTMRPLPWGGLRVMAMPSPGHPAIDAGVSGCLADIDLDADTPDQPLLIDLRQLPRPAVNGARRCDLGAIQTRCDTTCTDTVVQSAPSDAAVTTSELRLQTRTDSPHASTAADTPETSRP